MNLDQRFLSRREWLSRAAGGFGALAFAALAAETRADESHAASSDPLAPKPPHFEPKAKRVIFLYSTGGVSHVDTFDHKPKLFADHGKSVEADLWFMQKGSFTRFLKKPNWAFKPAGESGVYVGEIFPELAGVIDDLCLINSMHTDTSAHDKGTLGMHTGSFAVPRPSIGSWTTYGLGTPNRNLPAFVVIAPAPPYSGAPTWGADFLPGCCQGTWVIPGREPIADVRPRVADGALQRAELELLASLDRAHRDARGGADAALEARMRSFETAFGMQVAAPEAFDVSTESDETLALYGVDRKTTQGFGWQCLVGRRLVERGVRFVELIDSGSSTSANWDSHGDMNDHARLARAIDRPIAGLIRDLKRTGLWADTLVVWATEFGRTPFNASADAKGREHHPDAFTCWLAGAGVKGGTVYGKTDEHGIKTAENPVHVHDLHATILHLLGLDHERLTFRHAGRDFRLTDVHGRVVKGVLS